ncbi:MAG: hypothetical protein KDC67_13900, partial [Ignavibacteriae bacterium]|nr:hypothetical protein [Ignavibacteriota bacterium]
MFENVEYIVANTNSGLKNNQLSVSEIESVKVEFINIVAQNSYIEYKDGEGKFIKARVELEGTTFELIYNYYIRYFLLNRTHISTMQLWTLMTIKRDIVLGNYNNSKKVLDKKIKLFENTPYEPLF